MKTNKKILAYAVISGIVIVGFVLIWNNFSKQKKQAENAPVENKTTLQEAGDDTRIFFASNGKTKIYKIKKDNRWSVIWNGKEGKTYDYVSNPVFSSDGTQLAYSAELDGQAWVVLNNDQEFFAYRKATSLVFSSDGKKLAFVAIKENASVVVVNGQESREYESLESFQTPTGTTSIIFSPDGQQIVYVVTEGDKTYVVVNGQEGAAFDGITEIYFNENGQLVYAAQQGNTVVTVVNNQIVSNEPSTGSQTSSGSSTDNSSSSSNSTNPSSKKPYRYKISTDKDINRGDGDSTNYGTCSAGANCNF